jgi:hypothetical protein
MRRFVIRALTADHMKYDEIGGVHSTHVTAKGNMPLHIPKHRWEGNIKMNLNQCITVWTKWSCLKGGQSR